MTGKRNALLQIRIAISIIGIALLAQSLGAQESDFPLFEVIRTWSATTPAIVKSRVEPLWPQTYGRVQSVWLVDAWIDEEGRVRRASLIRPKITPPNGFADAVVTAVRQWT